MSDMFKDTYRTLMIDQHFPDAPYITFSKFTGQDQIDRCVAAKVDSIHVTMKCHWGYSYYNTEVGTKHPALGGMDQAGDLINAAKRENLEVLAYFCMHFDNLAAQTHPDWCFCLPNSRPADFHEMIKRTQDRRSWHYNCFMTGYRQYCLDQIREFCANYPIDGVFIDIFTMGSDYDVMTCCCPTCLARYRKLGLDPHSTDPQMRYRMIEHWKENYAIMIREIRSVMDEARPGLSLSLNGGPMEVGQDTLEVISWPYSEGGMHPYKAIILRSMGMAGQQCGIPAGDDAYDAWPVNMVRIMTSTVLAHGCRTFFFFTQGRLGDGTFEPSKYDLMRVINSETEKKSAFIKGAHALTAAAVYHNDENWMESGVRNMCGLGDGAGDNYNRRTGAVLDMFRNISIPVDLLLSGKLTLKEAQKYQTIVLPERKCLSDREAEILSAYVREGGCLILSADTGLYDEHYAPRKDFALVEVMGIHYAGVNLEYQEQATGGYMRFSEDPIFKKLRKTDYYMPGAFIQTTVEHAQVLAYTAEPVGVENYHAYVGWGSLPAGDRCVWPCVTKSNYAKGCVYYCNAPLSRYAVMGVRWPEKLVQGIVEHRNVHAGIRLCGPEVACEATFFERDGKLYVHVLNQSVRTNQGTALKLNDLSIEMIDYRALAARVVYPEEMPLEVEGQKIALPPVEIHTIVEIEVEEIL